MLMTIFVIVLSTSKPTEQSTTAYRMVSSNGVDGNKGTCTHTAENVNNAWWMVDLAKESIVVKVEVTNRPLVFGEHSFAYRLGDFNIRVGIHRAYATNPLCFEHAKNTVAASTSSHKCNYPIRGRYLYIDQKLQSKPLTVCEVNVYGYYLN